MLLHRVSVNWTFSLGVTAEALRRNIDWKSAFLLERGQFGPKFQVQRVVPHQPFFLSQNWNDFPFLRCSNFGINFCRFITIYAIDGQTDRRTDGRTDGRTDRRTVGGILANIRLHCCSVYKFKRFTDPFDGKECLKFSMHAHRRRWQAYRLCAERTCLIELRQFCVHRDIKPDNILLDEEGPFVSVFM